MTMATTPKGRIHWHQFDATAKRSQRPPLPQRVARNSLTTSGVGQGGGHVSLGKLSEAADEGKGDQRGEAVQQALGGGPPVA
eukprot:gene10868-10947_t